MLVTHVKVHFQQLINTLCISKYMFTCKNLQKTANFVVFGLQMDKVRIISLNSRSFPHIPSNRPRNILCYSAQ